VLAEEALRRIGELYRIEAEIRGRPAEERRAVRQARSTTLARCPTTRDPPVSAREHRV
jgi:hypothetical protein